MGFVGLNTGVAPSSHVTGTTKGLLDVYSGVTEATLSTAEATAAPLVLVIRLGVCRVVFLGLPDPLLVGTCFLGDRPLFLDIVVTSTSDAKNTDTQWGDRSTTVGHGRSPTNKKRPLLVTDLCE